MIKNKINSLQFGSILVMMMMASFLGTGFFSVVKAAGVDAYLSIVIAFLLGFIIIWSFLYLFNYEPDLPLNKKIIKLFGKRLGMVINLLFALIALSMGLTSMFNLTNFITSQFLPETSVMLIGFIFTFLVILINIKGIETISRTCLILITLNMVLYLIAVLGLIADFDVSNLKPFLEYGIDRPLHGSIYILGFNISPIFLLLMIPKNSLIDGNKAKNFLIFFYILGMVLMFLVLFLTLGNLGIFLTSIYQYPEYIVLKNIDLFQFIDRIENILTIQWIFGLFINLSMVVFFLSNLVKNNNKSKLLTILISVIILIISKTAFINNTIYNNYIYKYSLIFRIGIVFLLTIMVIKIFYNKFKAQKAINTTEV